MRLAPDTKKPGQAPQCICSRQRLAVVKDRYGVTPLVP